MNKKYIICLDCGNVQVRTDIPEIVQNHYIHLQKGKVTCVHCDSKQHLATNNMRSLENYLNHKKKLTNTESHILNLVKRK